MHRRPMEKCVFLDNAHGRAATYDGLSHVTKRDWLR
jgi:hypothetical protein